MKRFNTKEDDCKHYVKNWSQDRGTYLCSKCGKDFTFELDNK